MYIMYISYITHCVIKYVISYHISYHIIAYTSWRRLFQWLFVFHILQSCVTLMLWAFGLIRYSVRQAVMYCIELICP